MQGNPIGGMKHVSNVNSDLSGFIL